MNRSLIVAVLTVTMIIMMSTVGFAYTAPHLLMCDNCHGKFLGSAQIPADPANANNACLGCHSNLGEASRMPVESDAMSNYFGSAAGQPAAGSRSTHTWGAYSAAGHPYNKAAKVTEPTNPALNATYQSRVNTANTVLCIRCHDAKGDNGDFGSGFKPFLRDGNADDKLCLDCHRARKTTTADTGSHPVAYRAYSTVYKTNTTAFRKKPLGGNSNNPTSNPGNYLSSGKIVCSTCHAPHYADSSSATLDNRSTANGSAADDPAKGLMGRLQNSKGALLRNDQVGATSSAINACSSCHKETANLNHNGKGQNIQCGICHGAHVDDTSLGGPNLNLVNRDFSNLSTVKGNVGVIKKVIYNTATSLRFQRADGKGICQVCHVPTPGVGIHDLPDTRAKDCMACHKHSDGFSAGDCTSCHGQPPMTSTVGGPNGKASTSYTLDEALTPHATHADAAYYKYACKNCHYDGTRADSHRTSPATFQSVFVDTAGSVGAPYRLNTPSDYNSSSRRCSGVYCHSNGAPRNSGNVFTATWKSYSTPSWQYGRNKILGKTTECSTCHESGSTLLTNAHGKHISSSIGCSVCHAATVNNATAITDRSKHANGVKDIKFATRPQNFFGVFSSSWNPAAGTCNNSCHSNGLGLAPAQAPKWTDSTTGDCGSCHAVPATTSLHTPHLSALYGPLLGTNCNGCHSSTSGDIKHANGEVNLNSNSCSTCHPNTSPIWATGSTVSCESCHTGTASKVTNPFGTYTAPLKSQNATLGHGQYPLTSACTACHNAAATTHIGALPTEKRLLTAGNALCTNCHISSVMGIYSTTKANMLTHAFVSYTTAKDYRAKDCAGCHDTHGTTNYKDIRTIVAGQTIRPITLATLSTALRVVTPNGNGVYNGLCQVCHTKAKYFKRNAAPDLTHNQGKNCFGCHLHKGSVMFAFQGNGSCDSCHGYPPASSTIMSQSRLNNYTNAKIETTSGAGGAHTVAGHIPKNAKKSDGWANCDNCHYNTTHNTGGTPVKAGFVDVKVDPAKYKFNNISAIKYTTKTCSNVSCHFKKTPNWTTGL